MAAMRDARLACEVSSAAFYPAPLLNTLVPLVAPLHKKPPPPPPPNHPLVRPARVDPCAAPLLVVVLAMGRSLAAAAAAAARPHWPIHADYHQRGRRRP